MAGRLLLMLAILPACAGGSTDAPPLPSRIALAPGATETEAWAASRLAELLGLPVVVATTAAATEAQVAVGHGAAVALGVDPEALAALGDDAYLVSAAASRGVPRGCAAVASSAGSARGTMNGAFAFLRALGFEFLAQDETVRPPTPTPPAALDVLFTPPFESRDMAAVPLAGPGGQRGPRLPFPPGRDLQQLPTNLSAALGFDGSMAFAPVGGKLGPLFPPGYTATAYNLMSASGSTFACGSGAPNASQKWLPCPDAYAEHPEWFACMNGSSGSPYPCEFNNRRLGPCWSVLPRL